MGGNEVNTPWEAIVAALIGAVGVIIAAWISRPAAPLAAQSINKVRQIVMVIFVILSAVTLLFAAYMFGIAEGQQIGERQVRALFEATVTAQQATILAQRKDQIIISGKREDGVVFIAPAAGTYELKIVDGAYSAWPSDAPNRQAWSFTIYVYSGSILWGERSGLLEKKYIGPVAPDAKIGGEEVFLTESEAKKAAQSGPAAYLSLRSGQTIQFVPIDESNAYSDNRGTVTIEISRVLQ